MIIVCANLSDQKVLFIRYNCALSAVQGKFFTQLRHSADGFGVVAEFFGRGIMNNTSVTTAAE